MRLSASPLEALAKWGWFRFLIPFLAFFIFFFLLLPHSVKAQEITPGQPTLPPVTDYKAPNFEPDVPKNLSTYTQSVLIEAMVAVSCQLSGINPTTSDGRCLGPDPDTGKIGYVNNDGGAIGFMNKMVVMLYTPPASSVDYISNLAQNFGIVEETQARWMDDAPRGSPDQDFTSGTGFAGLKPLLNVWEAFRNMVYLLFTLAFILIGVAVMLRLKIDPRTVMTLQNQIPKIIIGLLLVTFSFAIAGFLIDVMWIAIYIVYGAFNNIAGIDVTPLNPKELVGTTPLGAVGGLGGIGNIADNGAGAVKTVITGLFDNVVGGWLGNLIGGALGIAAGTSAAKVIGGVIGGVAGFFAGSAAPGAGNAAGASGGFALGTALGGLAGGILGAAVGANKIIGVLGYLVAFLIIAVALLWALIRVWFTLITSYISILLDIVFAPFWILGGLIPGSALTFNGWIRDLIANLAAFPAVIVILLLGKTFMDTMGASYSGQFVPPLIGNPADTKAFGALIGLGTILIAPTAATMMKNALKAPKLDFSGVGTAVGVGAGVFGIPSRMGTMAYHWSMVQNLPLINRFQKNRTSDVGKPHSTSPTSEPGVATGH
jgi:hypothetical protein